MDVVQEFEAVSPLAQKVSLLHTFQGYKLPVFIHRSPNGDFYLVAYDRPLDLVEVSAPGSRGYSAIKSSYLMLTNEQSCKREQPLRVFCFCSPELCCRSPRSGAGYSAAVHLGRAGSPTPSQPPGCEATEHRILR
jgi:hypothetical protein